MNGIGIVARASGADVPHSVRAVGSDGLSEPRSQPAVYVLLATDVTFIDMNMYVTLLGLFSIGCSWWKRTQLETY